MKLHLIVLSTFILTACGSSGDDTKESSTQSVATPISFDTAQIQGIITQRCASCHSATPTDDIFKVAPSNIMFDTIEQIKRSAPRIRARSVDSKTMPFMNKTNMTSEERTLIGQWINAGAPIE
jgi:uncharacterized membrane protein